MLSLFNLLFLGAVLLNDITLYIEGDQPAPTLASAVVPVKAHREFWRDDGKGKCSYQGYAVAFEQDWDEVSSNGEGEHVIKARPGVKAGQVMLITKKVCGDSVEPILRLGSELNSTTKLQDLAMFAVFDAFELKPRDRTPWLHQVLQKLVSRPEDPNAKQALGDIKAQAGKLPAYIQKLLTDIESNSANAK